ncbi:MAG TPA: aminoacyl-tRNA hydrolase [Thermoanaerobaculia bacterium]|nr:aminoacyl-tRNA hydrolase [Thermoanaerobaculia bacterium]
MSDENPVDAGESLALIVGLGNPGERYRGSRHNLGFEVVGELAQRWGLRCDRLECSALRGRSDRALLAMPQTYMNRSGYAVRCFVEHYGFPLNRVMIVYDDVSLPLGRVRARPGGSPGGHRGMESVIENLRSDRIPRLRLGIAPEEGSESVGDLVDYVLEPFAASEREEAEAMIQRGADVVEGWLDSGIEATMNRFNG